MEGFDIIGFDCLNQVKISIAVFKDEPAHEKRDFMDFQFVVFHMRMRSPVLATDMLEASSRSLLHVCEQQMLWRACTYVQACLSLCWSPM